uniref:Ig-like domain-containing protein n=1 Tax=Panagrolaimus sp. PS1159 TaxID=55785 RepID=A0AC35FPA4_9BILA
MNYLIIFIAFVISQAYACRHGGGTFINGQEWVEVNGFVLVCQSFPNGTVSFHGQKTIKAPKVFGASQTTVQCSDEQNGDRNVGEFWIENHRFNKTCRANGAVEVVNCISKEGVQIPLNRQIVQDGSRYTCEMTKQGTIRFSAAPIDEKKKKMLRKFFI